MDSFLPWSFLFAIEDACRILRVKNQESLRLLNYHLEDSASVPNRTQTAQRRRFAAFKEAALTRDSARRRVAVGVTQFPNAESARYRVKYPQPNVAIDSPQSLTNVSKFGQGVGKATSQENNDLRAARDPLQMASSRQLSQLPR